MIAPGLIQTQLSEYFWKDEERLEKRVGQQPIRHLGQPMEIAVFGSRDASSGQAGGAPVTRETVFEAAGLGEPVFAYAVLTLTAERRLERLGCRRESRGRLYGQRG